MDENVLKISPHHRSFLLFANPSVPPSIHSQIMQIPIIAIRNTSSFYALVYVCLGASGVQQNENGVRYDQSRNDFPSITPQVLQFSGAFTTHKLQLPPSLPSACCALRRSHKEKASLSPAYTTAQRITFNHKRSFFLSYFVHPFNTLFMVSVRPNHHAKMQL